MYENDYSHSSSIITKVVTFYFGQILHHRIIQKQVQDFLTAHHTNFVQRQQNLSNVPQARPFETIWPLLEQKVYEGICAAKDLNQLTRRIILKAK